MGMLKIANAMFTLYFYFNKSPKSHALILSVFSLFYYLVAIADSHRSLLVLIDCFTSYARFVPSPNPINYENYYYDQAYIFPTRRNFDAKL